MAVSLPTLRRLALSLMASRDEGFCLPPEYFHENLADPVNQSLYENVYQRHLE
jgi:hypothetical protein